MESNLYPKDIKQLSGFFASDGAVPKNLQSFVNLVVQRNCNEPLLKMLDYHFEKPGKFLRGRLAAAIGSALGVDKEDALWWGACIEMLHNSTLIHDDLQDGDTHRRGQLSVWQKFGMADAINAGNILLLSAPQCIDEIESSTELKLKLKQLYSRDASKVVCGQSFEFYINEFKNPQKLRSHYERCIQGKTATLFSSVAEGMALLAGKDNQQIRLISQLFLQMGLVFQIQDDILDLFGQKGRDEKASDIKEGKISIFTVELLSQKPEILDQVKIVMGKSREETTAEDIQWFLREIHQEKILEKIADDLKIRLGDIQEQLNSIELRDLRVLSHHLLQMIFKPIAHLSEFAFVEEFKGE